MDFLVLFLFYLALVLVGVVMICICWKTQYLNGLGSGGAQERPWLTIFDLGGLVQLVKRWAALMISVPVFGCLFSLIWGESVLGNFSFGNYTFIILHLVLQGMIYIEYTLEILGYCQELEVSVYYLLQPYLLLIVNLVFFTLSCVSNPGTITKENESLFLQIYEFDEVMFPKDTRCSTCDLRKPARSKHCSVCNRCVHRFDHHCVWVSNCIGAWNARYFLIYLLTLTASTVTMAIVSTVFLVQLVVSSDLYLETYMDDLGHLRVNDIIFLIQYLFLTFPRIVSMLGFVVVLSILLGGYLCFALYLAATNQTTNEWYRGDRAWCQHCPNVAKPWIYRNIHSHGFWSNLREIFVPAAAQDERKKK